MRLVLACYFDNSLRGHMSCRCFCAEHSNTFDLHSTRKFHAYIQSLMVTLVHHMPFFRDALTKALGPSLDLNATQFVLEAINNMKPHITNQTSVSDVSQPAATAAKAGLSASGSTTSGSGPEWGSSFAWVDPSVGVGADQGPLPSQVRHRCS